MDGLKRFWVWFKEGITEVGYNLYEAWKNGYYPFFIVLLLLSTQTYGQVTERTQKQAKVIENRTQSTQRYTPNNNRNDNYTPNRRIQRTYRPYYYNPNIYGYTPYWNPYRSWDGREYIITTDSNRKQSQRPPLRVSIGVLSEVTTQQPTISPYLVLGGKTFLMTQYHWGGWNSFPYYSNIYQWEVEEWEDEFINTQTQRREFVIGIGTTMKRISPFVGVGFPTIAKWDIYMDETYTLSSPRDLGYYSINERKQTKANIKLGMIYGWERFEGIVQLSMFEGLSLGDGLRLGIGLGIKL